MQYKEGDLVRVQGNSFASEYKAGKIRHHLKAGAVCTIECVRGDTVTVRGPYRHDIRFGELKSILTNATSQSVLLHQVKLAKQAMNKRDKYSNRRG